MSDPVREAFEAWHLSKFSYCSSFRKGERYADNLTQARWDDWLAACHAARAAAPSEADREWVRHLQSAFADPNDGVVLPHEYFARLCDIALAAPAALEEAAKACDAEVSEIAKTDDNAAIAASACTERIRAMANWENER